LIGNPPIWSTFLQPVIFFSFHNIHKRIFAIKRYVFDNIPWLQNPLRFPSEPARQKANLNKLPLRNPSFHNHNHAFYPNPNSNLEILLPSKSLRILQLLITIRVQLHLELVLGSRLSRIVQTQ